MPILIDRSDLEVHVESGCGLKKICVDSHAIRLSCGLMTDLAIATGYWKMLQEQLQ
jgi:hypothetical protein